jgi:hypothetical protein
MAATEKSTATANDRTNTTATAAPNRPAATPAVTAPVAVDKLVPKAPTKRVTRKVASATAKTAEQKTTKAVVKAPVKTVIKTAAKPVAKPVLKTSVKLAALPKTEKSAKPKKPKLVRDSFTIPKAEYAVLDDLKQRATQLNSAVKKSELIRAGIKALAAMSDTAFLAALKAVPTIKTGRPTKSKAD